LAETKQVAKIATNNNLDKVFMVQFDQHGLDGLPIFAKNYSYFVRRMTNKKAERYTELTEIAHRVGVLRRRKRPRSK
jgi:hypothetical protein